MQEQRRLRRSVNRHDASRGRIPAIAGGSPAFDIPLPSNRPVRPDPATLHAHLDGILDRGRYTNNGPLVVELESRLAKKLQVRNCVLCSSATMGLELLARALDLGGEVIVPSFTFIATPHAFQTNGGTPVFCDVDSSTMSMSPGHCRQLISSQTRAICAVHLWGRPADIPALQDIANERDIPLLFDAAHAFGVVSDGRAIGGFGRAEVFSFHATKLFHTMEGGAVATDDDDLAESLRRMRNFGFVGYDETAGPGINGKMTEMSAAFGLCALEQFDAHRQRSRQVNGRYRDALRGMPGIQPMDHDHHPSSNQQYVTALIDQEAFGLSRDQILASLHAENIIARKYFAPGCHRMEPYASRIAGIPDLPATDQIAGQILVLPGGAAIDDDEIDSVLDALECIHRHGAMIHPIFDGESR